LVCKRGVQPLKVYQPERNPQNRRPFLLKENIDYLYSSAIISVDKMKKKTKTWLELATNDLALARELLDRKGKVYYAAHFCHQAIEKLLKAIISEHTNEIPLPTHNFKILLDQARLKDIPDEKKRLIFSLMPHYIGTKYPEDINKLYKQYTGVFVQRLYKETQGVFKWLKAYLK